MHRLDRIRIAGFKSIRDQTLDLQPLNVLIGANGAGKSNFIEVFRLLHEMVSQNLQLFVARSGGAGPSSRTRRPWSIASKPERTAA